MHRDNHDFYGHPKPSRYGIPAALGFVFLASLAVTAWYAQSNYQALNEANKRAQQEVGSLRP